MTVFGFSEERDIEKVLRMIRTSPKGGRSFSQDVPIPTSHYLLNDSGKVITPYSMLAVTDLVEVAGRFVLKAKKPNQVGVSASGMWAWTGPVFAQPGSIVNCQLGPIVKWKYQSSTVISAGDKVGNMDDRAVPLSEAANPKVTGRVYGTLNKSRANVPTVLVNVATGGDSERQIIPLTLKHTGGQNGTVVTTASWTYQVTDFETGDLLYGGASVEVGHPFTAGKIYRPVGHLKKADVGLAVNLQSTDDPWFIYAAEVPDYKLESAL